MELLKYTLLTDGSSDKILLNIIKWLLDDLYPQLPCDGSFADFRHFPRPPQTGDVIQRVKYSQEYYPFDILFYHRDAEKFDIPFRKEEILNHIDSSLSSKIVCVIPVKMMETWLLINTDAIKKAAGNRNYTGNIDLPSLKKLESLTKPKEMLHDLLKNTSGFNGRRLKNFNVHYAVHLVAENIKDYSPLRKLSAFREFEKDLKVAVELFLSSK